MVKTLNKLGIKGDFLNMIFKNPIVNIFKGERLFLKIHNPGDWTIKNGKSE